AHALIDQINRGLWSSDAPIIHEALADFWSSSVFNNPCYGPYDAQEFEDRKCVRDLSTQPVFPKDMTWTNPHKDSLILSSSLWEAKDILGARFGDIILETVIRLPKKAELLIFWPKMLNIFSRLEMSSEDFNNR